MESPTDMGNMGGETGSSGELTATGVDFSNATQAMDFLDDLLDDTALQVVGNQYATYFWYGIASAIAVAAAINLISIGVLAVRRRQASSGRQDSARPKNIVMRWLATATAILRETAYAQVTPTKYARYLVVPPLGTLFMILAYLGFVLVLEFSNSGGHGAQYHQQLGIRAGWLAVAQVPLLILLAGKVNWIGMLTGVSYERLNVLHRWVARMLLLLAILHFAHQGYGWAEFSGIFRLEWTSDSCITTGLPTFVILIWMNLSTIAPFRNMAYEVFVFQHLITFFGFIIALMMHLPSTALYSRVYIYIPIAFYLVDRLIRTARAVYNNARASRATLAVLDGHVTRITLRNVRVKSWSPGSYVLLAFPSIKFGQSHPATIVSTPQSHGGDMVFMLKSHKGFTNSLMKKASLSATPLEKAPSPERPLSSTDQGTCKALIDGPYGGKHADFGAFDSTCLVAGSIGITFVIPILLDIAYRAEKSRGRLPIRRLCLVWCLKQLSNSVWAQEELQNGLEKLRRAGIETDLSFYVTCDKTFTQASDDLKASCCDCDKSIGPCCCQPSENEKMTADVVAPLLDKRPSFSAIDDDLAQMSPDEDMTTDTLTRVMVKSGRPNVLSIVERLLESAQGESAIAVCGPLGLSTAVRNAVVYLSDQKAIHKGGSTQGVYLHVEGFN